MDDLVAKYAGAYNSDYEPEESGESTDVSSEESSEEGEASVPFSTLLTQIFFVGNA